MNELITSELYFHERMAAVVLTVVLILAPGLAESVIALFEVRRLLYGGR